MPFRSRSYLFPSAVMAYSFSLTIILRLRLSWCSSSMEHCELFSVRCSASIFSSKCRLFLW